MLNIVLLTQIIYKRKTNIMSNKTISIVSYLSIIGWVIAYISYKNANSNASLCRYHLKQGLGVSIISILINIILVIIASVSSSIAIILSLVGLGVIILWVFGIINAVNEQEKPVPLVGGQFENKFHFIQ
jgi:uncharacterized membrane protein